MKHQLHVVDIDMSPLETACRRSSIGEVCFVMSPEVDYQKIKSLDIPLWCKACHAKLMQFYFPTGGEE